MKKLCELRRIRKRYDSVKLALALLLCAGYFFVLGAVRAVDYAQQLNRPAEYLLQAQSESAALADAPAKLCEIDGIAAASFQRDFVITAAGQKMLTVSMLSPEYLYSCYGIKAEGGGMKVWLASASFDALFGAEEAFHIGAFSTADGMQKSAEFIRCTALDKTAAEAVAVGTTASLGDTQLVRVMLRGADTSQTALQRAESLGYSVCDREALLTRSHAQEMLLSDLGHCAVCIGLSLLGAFAFFRIYRFRSQSPGENSQPPT